MHQLRFNIASLLMIMLITGVGFAASRESSDLSDSGVFNLALGVLLVSRAVVAHSMDSSRGFWIGFALFGWVYLGLSLIPSLESRLISTKGLHDLDANVPGRSTTHHPGRTRRPVACLVVAL